VIVGATRWVARNSIVLSLGDPADRPYNLNNEKVDECIFFSPPIMMTRSTAAAV
jgi:hypothetical protein